MLTVLVVEDDKWLALSEKTSLEKGGFSVCLAHDSVAAMKQIDTHTPDVIVLDILLPAATCFSFLQELSSYGDTVKIPIILASNLTHGISLKELAPYGVRRILDKSTMTPDDLVAAVRSVS